MVRLMIEIQLKFFELSLEFDLEREMLINDTLPKLQQYFLTKGIYVYFVDCHLNWENDLSRNPYHVHRYMKELDDAYRTSTGLFLIVCQSNHQYLSCPSVFVSFSFEDFRWK